MDLVSLKAELRQELKLTPQLLQSMEILQMNSQELAEYLNRAAEENPLLEQEEAPELRQAYEEMCREAVRQGKRIGVMATLPTTLNPTKNTILRVAREMNRQVELVDALVDGGFGLDQEQFKALMSEYAGTIADKVDVILFAQGSMAYCEEYIHEKYGKVVLSSPRFGAAALKDALVKKGLM